MTMLNDLITITEDLTPVEGTLEEQMEELTKRMSAARRGLGFANMLKDPGQKKKHMSIVMGNMNRIRAALARIVKHMEQFTRAESEYETHQF